MEGKKGRVRMHDENADGRKPSRPIYILICFYLLTFCFGLSSVYAQEDTSQLAPPPLKQISKEEKEQLDAETDIKDRTKLALELMSARLKKAEELSAGEGFDDMFTELGGFHALMDNTLAFLTRSDQNNGKILNNFKRFEIGLRMFTPRLEVIRRESPVKYETYVRNLIKYLRDTRTKAVEPFFGTSVVPDGGN